MRRLAGLFAGALVACPPVPDDGRYRCQSRGECGAGLACVDGLCAACEPRTCADDPGACGRLDDGCGATLDCACALPDTCGGGGAAGRCGCSFASSCAALYPRCGEDALACSVPCGCPFGERCQDGRCAPCVPATCDELGLGCGSASDGCGGRVDCGPCEAPATCRPTPAGAACLAPEPCLLESRACGAATDGTPCGACALGHECDGGRCQPRAACAGTCGLVSTASGAVSCGACPVGEGCAGGACLPLPRPFCFGPPTAWLEASFGPRSIVAATVYGAPAGLRALVATDAWHRAGRDDGCSRIFALDLSAPGRVSSGPPSAYEPFSDFPGLTVGVDCRPEPNATCTGWISRPRVRRDGKEAFFVSSHPCADWWDNEAYVLVRTLDGDWGRPEWLSSVSDRAPVPPRSEVDGLRSVLLLPDDRTLLVAPLGAPEWTVWRRPSPVPGDLRFTKVAAIPTATLDPSGSGPEHLELSCDRRHILYVVRDGALQRPRRVELLGLDPLTFGPAQSYEGIGQAPIFELAEAEGCEGIYTSESDGQTARALYRPRVPCPR